MIDPDEFKAIVSETRTLVKKAAKGKPRKISVSKEVAEMLEGVGGQGTGPEQEGQRVDLAPPRSAQQQPTPVRAATVPKAAATPPKPAAPKAPQIVVPPPDAADPAMVAELETLERAVSTCTKCRLSETRNKTVFGEGHPHASLVFVGEAPGADEDAQGIPFIGRAGKLLTTIIEQGMKIKRCDVYICNVLKCRPPGNRDPRPDEKELCEPYLLRQLDLLEPQVICALGAHAAHTLLKVDTAIGRLRGSWHFYHQIPLRVTYHPAYLLRSPGEKRKTWDDIQAVMRLLAGQETPEPPTPEAPEPENLSLFS